MTWVEAAAGRKNLRQLLNHVICLLKAHFASLCVTWAWRMRIVERGWERVKKQMPQMQENFRLDSQCVSCKKSSLVEEEGKPPVHHPLHIDLKNFSVLKKRRQRGRKIKQTQAKKVTREEFEASTSESGRKVLFPEYKFHSLSIFHWSSNMLSAFYRLFFLIFLPLSRASVVECLQETRWQLASLSIRVKPVNLVHLRSGGHDQPPPCVCVCLCVNRKTATLEFFFFSF